jgi:hypothetical protein
MLNEGQRSRRPTVKQLSRSSRSSVLEKLREECTERFVRDRESLRERVRQEIEKSNASVDEIDIDKFVEDFLADYDEEIQGPPEYPPDWVWCPVCMEGFIVSPVPGVIVCESCCEFKLGVSENFNVPDLVPLLDSAIRAHADGHCQNSRPQFSVHNNSLTLHCSVCRLSSIVQ